MKSGWPPCPFVKLFHKVFFLWMHSKIFVRHERLQSSSFSTFLAHPTCSTLASEISKTQSIDLNCSFSFPLNRWRIASSSSYTALHIRALKIWPVVDPSDGCCAATRWMCLARPQRKVWLRHSSSVCVLYGFMRWQEMHSPHQLKLH